MQIRTETSINPSQSIPRLLSGGHFHTKPGYCVVREQPRSDWLLFYTLSGRGRIVHLDGPLLTEAGQCIIYPPGVPQGSPPRRVILYRIMYEFCLLSYMTIHEQHTIGYQNDFNRY